MLIAAFRSLNRDFRGIVVKRTVTSGVISNQYYLHLKTDSQDLSQDVVINTLIEKEQPSHHYGVSAFVYERAQLFEIVSKRSLSFSIHVGGEKFFDLGLLWLMMSLAGIAIAITMHYQTLDTRSSPKYQSEEIDIPGLE